MQQFPWEIPFDRFAKTVLIDVDFALLLKLGFRGFPYTVWRDSKRLQSRYNQRSVSMMKRFVQDYLPKAQVSSVAILFLRWLTGYNPFFLSFSILYVGYFVRWFVGWYGGLFVCPRRRVRSGVSDLVADDLLHASSTRRQRAVCTSHFVQVVTGTCVQ